MSTGPALVGPRGTRTHTQENSSAGSGWGRFRATFPCLDWGLRPLRSVADRYRSVGFARALLSRLLSNDEPGRDLVRPAAVRACPRFSISRSPTPGRQQPRTQTWYDAETHAAHHHPGVGPDEDAASTRCSGPRLRILAIPSMPRPPDRVASLHLRQDPHEQEGAVVRCPRQFVAGVPLLAAGLAFHYWGGRRYSRKALRSPTKGLSGDNVRVRGGALRSKHGLVG